MRGKPKNRNLRENYLDFLIPFCLFIYFYLLWKILLEKFGKKNTILFEAEIFGGSAGLDIACEAKFLDKTSCLHAIIESKIILPLAHLQEAALRK